jgi:hypothetical protein
MFTLPHPQIEILSTKFRVTRAGQARPDLAELEAESLAPGEEPRDGAGVGALDVRVVDSCLEKLFGGEDRLRAIPDQNFGKPGSRALKLATPNRNNPIHSATTTSVRPYGQ